MTLFNCIDFMPTIILVVASLLVIGILVCSQCCISQLWLHLLFMALIMATLVFVLVVALVVSLVLKSQIQKQGPTNASYINHQKTTNSPLNCWKTWWKMINCHFCLGYICWFDCIRKWIWCHDLELWLEDATIIPFVVSVLKLVYFIFGNVTDWALHWFYEWDRVDIGTRLLLRL